MNSTVADFFLDEALTGSAWKIGNNTEYYADLIMANLIVTIKTSYYYLMLKGIRIKMMF